MAAGGWLLTVGLLGLRLPLALVLRPQQPQPLLFVHPGQPVDILCEARKEIESRKAVSWYWRGEGRPVLVLSCWDRTQGEFSCEFGKDRVTLHIARARPEHSGIYLCAYFYLGYEFGTGTVLVVGDHWDSRSWVRVFASHGDPQAPPRLFCAVGATAAPVIISWPGGSQRVLRLRGSVGPLLSAMGTPEGAGGVCEVRFNASGPPIRRSLEPPRLRGSCMTPGTRILVTVIVLLLLSLCLSVYCLHRSTATALPPPDHQLSTPMPPRLQEDEGQLTYAHLVFSTPAP